MNNDVINILNTIKNNLNGDFDHDFNYLMKQLDLFKSMKAEFISSEIIKIMNESLGEKAKEKIKELIKEQLAKRKERFKLALELEQLNKYEEAQNILVELVDSTPYLKASNQESNDQIKIVSFNNFFESVLFLSYFNKDAKKILPCEEPLNEYYFHMGYIMFALEDYEEAVNLLNNSIQYNPLSIDTLLLKADCNLLLGQEKLYQIVIDECLKVCYTRSGFAKSYLSLANYFYDKQEKEIALACSLLARSFEINPTIDQTIDKIIKLDGTIKNQYTTIDFQEILKKFNIQFGPSKEVMNTLVNSIKDSKTKNDVKLITYFLRIFYDLTKDPNVLKELQEYDKNLNEGEN